MLKEEITYYSLTNSQKSIMIIDQFSPGNQFVWQTNTVKIFGSVDFQLLKQAIHAVIKANDIFQCRITNRFQEIKQYFVPFEEKEIELLDFSYPGGMEDYFHWVRQKSKQNTQIYDTELYSFSLLKFNDQAGGFYFKCHHLICDAWSFVLSINQIVESYRGLVHGSPLTIEAYSYLEHIFQEQKYLSSERYLKDRAFWQDTLETVKDPILFDQGNRKGFSAKRKTMTLTAKDHLRIKELCSTYGITPFILFVSFMAIFFMKTKDKNPVVIGATVLNRMSLKDKKTTGPFFNDVPFVIPLDPAASYEEFVKEVSLRWLELLRHSNYPYISILKDYREKHKVKDRLFDVTLTFVTAAYQQDSSSEIAIERHFNNEEVSSLCVSIEDIEAKGVYNITYDYADDFLTEKDIDAIHHSLLNMLAHVSKNPDQKVEQIHMLSEEELHKIIFEFNPAVDYKQGEENILEMFSSQVARYPDQTALIFNGDKLTYRELDRKTDQLAGVLVKKGVKKEEIVALIVHRSFDLVIGILGILKAGAAYLPIDPSYPQDRVNFMLEDSGCRFMVSNGKCKGLADRSQVTVVNLDSEEVERGSALQMAAYPQADDLAYVIYTSGSTGLPKGVMIEHGALANFVKAVAQEIDFTNKTMLSLTTVSFDIFFLETIFPLLIGMTVVIAGDEEKDDPAVLPELIQRYKIDILQATPSKMSIIIHHPSIFKGLSDILIGGEALPETLLHQLKPLTTAKIFNMYGPTEATIWSSVKCLDQNHAITIGKPMANTKYYILDQYLQPVPIGVPGEIYIGGDSLARGYLNRPDITAERFIANPFLPGTRLYKTGDLGRWTDSGEIEFIGRNDNQIKIRGFRVETGEIEKRLLENNGIKQAVVTVVSENNKKLLCAYYSGTKLSQSELRASLAAFLPEYMIPNRFVWLEKMPLTPNGKIDRQALPECREGFADRADYTPPGNEIESILAEIWRTVLGLPLVGIDDDFFALGGDSLDILEILTALLPYRWGLTAQDFYEFPTIHSLAAYIQNRCSVEKPETAELIAYPAKVYRPAKSNQEPIRDGDILLTGATGFFGMHILKELCDVFPGKVYCLVRGKDYRQKFDSILEFYYPGFKTTEQYNKITLVKGDITQKGLDLSAEDDTVVQRNVKSVIHCASLVKHFGSYAEFERVNVKGTENVIAYCLANRLSLHYISTTSVSGNFTTNSKNIKQFCEDDFFIGQDIKSNVYLRSKFEAESLIQKAMRGGLTASIYRVGILTGRFADGKFQYNIEENANYLRLRSIFGLQCLPKKVFGERIEFTPVDHCAKAFVTLFMNDCSPECVFHLYNHNLIEIRELLKVAETLGFKVDEVSDKAFIDKVTSISKTERGKELLSGIITALTAQGITLSAKVEVKSEKTIATLEKYGFSWEEVSAEYLTKLIQYMTFVGFLQDSAEKRGFCEFI